MTEPIDADVLTLATPYALHAMTDGELAHVDRLVAAASPSVAHAFAEEVRAVRETMAVVSAATAIEPPDSLRDRLLASLDNAPAFLESAPAPVVQLQPRRQAQGSRWRMATLATAAAVAIGLGGLGVGWVLHPKSTISTQDQIFSASDVKTVTGDIPTGGTATVVFSRERNAAVLVMNNVNPPAPGTVYQMWLVGNDGPHSAGTMSSAQVAPSTTAVLNDLDKSQTLAFTVEPGGGSAQPTTPVFAQLPLI